MNKLVLYSYLPDFACSLESFRKANDLSYDLIFSHYWLSGQVGQEVRSWWGVPHIQMFHTLGVIKNSLGVGEEEPELRIEKEQELARDCDRIIAATAREKAILVDVCGAAPERVAVIPCGVNLHTFHPIDRTTARTKVGLGEGKIVLFAGRIEPLKGIDLLVKAFAALPGRRRLVSSSSVATPQAPPRSSNSKACPAKWASVTHWSSRARSDTNSCLTSTMRLTSVWSRPITRASGWWLWRPWPVVPR